MEFALVLRELLRRRRVLAAGVLVATLAAVFSVYRLDGLSLKPRSLQYSSATTQVFVDTPSSVLGNLTQALPPLQARATVYANFMASPSVLQLIGEKGRHPGRSDLRRRPDRSARAAHRPGADGGAAQRRDHRRNHPVSTQLQRRSQPAADRHLLPGADHRAGREAGRSIRSGAQAVSRGAAELRKHPTAVEGRDPAAGQRQRPRRRWWDRQGARMHRLPQRLRALVRDEPRVRALSPELAGKRCSRRGGRSSGRGPAGDRRPRSPQGARSP